jgi:hypothetical protein
MINVLNAHRRPMYIESTACWLSHGQGPPCPLSHAVRADAHLQQLTTGAAVRSFEGITQAFNAVQNVRSPF